MSLQSPLSITYDEKSIAIYCTTLRSVRHDLRKTGHIIDSRALTRNLDSHTNSLPLFKDFDDLDLPTFSLPTPNLSDVIIPDDATQALVDQLSQVPTNDDLQILADEAIAYNSRSAEDLELPLLSSNHARDFEDFLYDSSPGSRPNPIHTSVLPCEPVNCADDWGMAFPKRAQELLTQIKETVISETIVPTAEDLVLVAEALHNESTDSIVQELIVGEFEFDLDLTRGKAMTPPLLPSDDDEIEDEDATLPDLCQLNSTLGVTSDRESLLDEDIELVANVVHAESPPNAPQMHLSSTPHEPESVPFTPPLYVKMSDLMREAPLMSESISPYPTPVGNRLPIHLGPLQDLTKESSPPDYDTATNECNPRPAEEDLSEILLHDEDLGRLLQRSVEQVFEQLEGEKPDPMDTVARLQVLELDFNIPKPEWASINRSDEMFEFIRQYWATPLELWPRNRHDERSLRWTPFPSNVARMNLDESLGDYEELSSCLTIPSPESLEEEPQLGTCCLKILQHEDDDMISTEFVPCELSPTMQAQHLPTSSSLPSSATDDLMDLARKRKRHHQSLTSTPYTRILGSSEQSQSPDSLLLAGNDPNATTRLLSNYLDLHDTRQRNLTNSTVFSIPKRPPPSLREQAPQMSAPCAVQAPPPLLNSFPCPEINAPDGPVRFFISSTIPRVLISGFQKYLLVGVEMLDRDFAAPGRWLSSQQSSLRANNVSSLAHEADVAISPSTGILVTTLLKVRQKPLPGSGDTTSQIRKRIEIVGPLYERLIVLVWQDGQDDSSAAAPLSAAEAEAYSDFAKKNDHLPDAHVETVYVGGGPRHLVARTIGFVHEHLSYDLQHLLKEEETEWEVILRQAGLNIYAAQVLIASLKQTYGDEGLTPFLQLPLQEKLERYQGLLGGSAVLGRVCTRLEQARVPTDI